MSFVTVRAAGVAAPVTVAYERHGAGEPVVLLHGLGMDLHAWGPVVPLLTGDHDVIAMDLPGFGLSPDWPAGVPRDLPTTTAVLGAVFTALGVARPHVAGHSLGGLIGLRLAQAGLARSVTALAPAGFWNAVERRYAFAIMSAVRDIARALPSAAVALLSETPLGKAALTGTLYADPNGRSPEDVVTCLRTLRDAVGFNATLRAGRAPGLFTGGISGVPVTIAWGTADRILPPHQAKRAKKALPTARLVWLTGCGHVPMNDAPDLVARTILETTHEKTRRKTRQKAGQAARKATRKETSAIRPAS